MKQFIDRYFRPDAFFPSLDRVHFAGLYRRGFRLVMLDLDNTLSGHGVYEADEYAVNCVKTIKEHGFFCWLVTNARTKRGQAYAATLDIPVRAMAGKPSAAALLQICHDTGIPPQQCVLIGDQIFTDIWSAKRAGCHAVLVKPRFSDEAWNVKIKRYLEKPLYRRFRLSMDNRMQKNKSRDWRGLE